MRFFQQKRLHLQGRNPSIGCQEAIELVPQPPARSYEKIDEIITATIEKTLVLKQFSLKLLKEIKAIGACNSLDDYEKRKLGIFNQLNFFQLITGIIVPIAGLAGNKSIPVFAWLIASTPALISILVLWLNKQRNYDVAMIAYFILYPFVTSVVYMSGMNLGVELFFILYGILSVFFFQRISHMLFSVALSMISYFMLFVLWKTYRYQLETSNLALYLFNQLLAIVFIFYGLYLVKKENTGYQFSMLAKNRALHEKNLQIEQQKKEIAEKASLLNTQTATLTELDSLKNKLFSVIAHDLKAPIYALRNLFRNMELYNLPATEIKEMIPDVLKDLNFTTGLMENLLQWAKSQMQADAVKTQTLDICQLMQEVIQLLRLQAEAKHICIERDVDSPVFIAADKDMIGLVLRNLLSNAIKFTPNKGRITLGIHEMPGCVEVFIQDSGMGMNANALQKINQNDFYTTKGTANESGTGLGLMLCKEFLARNGGQMHIDSEPGKGSVFSFTLPKPPEHAAVA